MHCTESLGKGYASEWQALRLRAGACQEINNSVSYEIGPLVVENKTFGVGNGHVILLGYTCPFWPHATHSRNLGDDC